MRAYLKVAAGFALIAIVGLGISFVLYLHDDTRCDAFVITGCSTITISGDITPEMFVDVGKYLVESTAPEKTFVIEASGNGDAFAALAIAKLVHRHNWNVEVVHFCGSSCANFIFPAGKRKYLHRDSLLLFHGGPYQANLLESVIALDRELAKGGTLAEPITFGRKDKEGTMTFSGDERSPAGQEVFEFLSVHAHTATELLLELRRVSDQLYQELGVDPLLPTYGQIGEYEPIYKSYEYDGYFYRPDSLRRFGIGNIELKDGEWHPEHHPVYERVYEVTYPQS